MALRASIDASTQNSGVFSIAAVAFGYDRASKANKHWVQALKGRTFHMTDLNSKRGEFAGIEDEEVDHIMKTAVSSLRDHASFVIAVSCDLALVKNSLPLFASKHPDMDAMLAAFRSTYGLMCHLLMYALGIRANDKRGGRQISYVLEQGDEGQRGFRKYLEFLGEEPHHALLLNGYSLNQITVAEKGDIEGAFHSADLVAWEWARHVPRHSNGARMRGSLKALSGGIVPLPDKYGISMSDGDRFFFRHFSEERLATLLAFFRETLAATTTEEAHAAFDRYRTVYPAQ